MNGLWNIKWLRRFFRRRMNPVPVDRAFLWKRRLAVGYMVLAWNAFGVVLYMMYSGKSDWGKYYGYRNADEEGTPGEQWAKTLMAQNAKIVRFSGFNRDDSNKKEG